jgi:hypothetical protein
LLLLLLLLLPLAMNAPATAAAAAPALAAALLPLPLLLLLPLCGSSWRLLLMTLLPPLLLLLLPMCCNKCRGESPLTLLFLPLLLSVRTCLLLVYIVAYGCSSVLDTVFRCYEYVRLLLLTPCDK